VGLAERWHAWRRLAQAVRHTRTPAARGGHLPTAGCQTASGTPPAEPEGRIGPDWYLVVSQIPPPQGYSRSQMELVLLPARSAVRGRPASAAEGRTDPACARAPEGFPDRTNDTGRCVYAWRRVPDGFWVLSDTWCVCAPPLLTVAPAAAEGPRSVMASYGNVSDRPGFHQAESLGCRTT
jgi:hypothetical protein